MKKFISLAVGFCMTLSLGVGSLTGCKEAEREFENVILVIGDGMGENHILNAITYFDLDTPVFFADQAGYLATDSLDGTTDSAAAGTALATGNKVHNGNVAQLDGKDLQRITDIAKKAKMKTGVITTDTLDGATPAAFSAHTSARSASTQIIKTQAKSGVDLLMGRWISQYTLLSDEFTGQGYTVVRGEEDMLNAKDADKLVGLLSGIDSEYTVGCEDDFQLKSMAEFAVEYLENENGFFLMIEGAYIDKYSHNNDFTRAMSETRSLIDTISFLYEYAADGKTAIIITADHETGGLIKAESADMLSGNLYTSTGHTSANVPVYVKNYVWNPEKFGYKKGVTPENTMVFEACKSIIQGK